MASVRESRRRGLPVPTDPSFVSRILARPQPEQAGFVAAQPPPGRGFSRRRRAQRRERIRLT
jgi:hypothetical protein